MMLGRSLASDVVCVVASVPVFRFVFEAALRCRDLLVYFRHHLLEYVWSALFGLIEAQLELMEIGAQHFLHFGLDFGEAAASLADAANHANEFGARAFPGNGLGAVLVFGEDFQEPLLISTLVGTIGLSHQILPFDAIIAVRRKIGMNALCHIAKQALHLGRGSKRARRLGRFFSRDGLRLVGASASLAGSMLGPFVFRMGERETLGDAGPQFVQFGIARTDEVKILPLECGEFRTE